MPHAGRCIADSDHDCRRSQVCPRYGFCYAYAGRCAPPPDVGTHNRSDDVRDAGMVVTLVAPLFTATGLALAFAGKEDAQLVGLLGFMPLSGAMLVAGVPLWALGEDDIPADQQPRDVALMVGGTVLASLGLGAITASAFFVPSNKIALLPVGAGALALAGGASMAGYGALPVPTLAGPSATRPSAPRLGLGPGGATLTGEF